MDVKAPRVVVNDPNAGSRTATPARDYQGAWLTLARSPWTSMVLVPVDADDFVAEIATGLAEFGRRFRQTPVSFFIVQDALSPESAGKIASSIASKGPSGADRILAPAEQVIVAIRPVIDEPLGLALAEAADAVVLCVELGRTRLAAARRTIDLIGRERIRGSLLIS